MISLVVILTQIFRLAFRVLMKNLGFKSKSRESLGITVTFCALFSVSYCIIYYEIPRNYGFNS